MANTPQSKVEATNADTKWMAENRVLKHLLNKTNSNNHEQIKKFVHGATRIGTQSWIVLCGNPGRQPFRPSYFLIDCDGEINLMSPESLSKIMRTEFEPNVHDSDHEKFIEDFIKLLYGDEAEIIDDARIDELKSDPRKPIPENLTNTIRPQYKGPDGTYILFTYQQFGGYVRRCEFNYSPNGIFKECIVSEVISRVGPYWILE